jgi:hypothetical protein
MAEEVEHGGLVAGEKFVAQGHRTGGDEVANIRGHAFADAWDGEERLWVSFGSGDGRERQCLLLYSLCGAAVGANAKWVSGVDFQQGGGFVEQTRECDVVHNSALGCAAKVKGPAAAHPDCKRCGATEPE